MCVFFFARVSRLLEEGVQADLLFCLLSGHSSELWPSPKLKPLGSDWSSTLLPPRGRVGFESAVAPRFGSVPRFKIRRGKKKCFLLNTKSCFIRERFIDV